MERPVLLLGATGLLGRNVLNLLLERGIPVRALVRHPLPVEGLDTVMGSILDRETLLQAAEGCRAVINCAGTTDMTLPSVEDFLPVNRDLPALLCEVIQERDIPVLIHVSTANTIASGTQEHPSDESAPIGPIYGRSPYALSKKAGEGLLLSFAKEHPEKRIVVLNPGFLVGPFDAKPSSGQLLLAGWRKSLMVVPRGGKSFLHVRDAAAALVNALEKGEGRYLLTGEMMLFKDFYALQAQVCGYRQRYICLPDWLAHGVGFLGDCFRKLGFRVSFYSHNVNQLLLEEWYCCSRAREQLDYVQTPVSEAIADFFRWRETV
jgi:dihydroflavonol-4-reductase